MYLLLAQDLSHVVAAGEQSRHVRFEVSEVEGTRQRIDQQRRDAALVIRAHASVMPYPAQLRSDAREQFVGIERAQQVIVGAEIG